MVIYVDELFLENFIMNYIILYITAYFSKIKPKWYRLSLASALGAIYVILTYIVNISIYNSLISKAILSILIVIVGFNFKRTVEFLKIICIFYLTTFAIGGAGFCIGYFSDAVTITETGMIYVKEISLKIVIISILITFIMAKVVVMILKNRTNLSAEYFDIDIFLEDKKAKLSAFLDTGNTIHEPFSKRSVVFAEGEELRDFFPKEIYEVLIKGEDMEKIKEDFWKSRIVLIPVSTINESYQIKCGIRTDKIVVHDKECNFEKERIAVVLCNNISKDGSYSAIIGKSIFEM
ncbi:MAG: hypothetical protein E7314_05025 [Clostridiales bacterium]|nr:hypothetical protein [Clostridiales bacterium]